MAPLKLDRIPFVDLAAQLRSIRPEIDAAISSVLQSCLFVQGPHVLRDFEARFAAASGAAHCAAAATARRGDLACAGGDRHRRGDEVITVANTFIATAEAVCHVGATPVFVETEAAAYTMDAAAAAAAITPRTKALLPVHLHGTPRRYGGDHGDRAKARLARHRRLRAGPSRPVRGRPVGTFGAAGTSASIPARISAHSATRDAS